MKKIGEKYPETDCYLYFGDSRTHIRDKEEPQNYIIYTDKGAGDSYVRQMENPEEGLKAKLFPKPVELPKGIMTLCGIGPLFRLKPDPEKINKLLPKAIEEGFKLKQNREEMKDYVISRYPDISQKDLTKLTRNYEDNYKYQKMPNYRSFQEECDNRRPVKDFDWSKFPSY